MVVVCQTAGVSARAGSAFPARAIDRLLPLSRHTLRVHRVAHKLYVKGHRPLAICVCDAWKLLTGIEVRPPAVIGDHVQFVHGQGVVIGASAVIGAGTRILQQVSVGNDGLTEDMPVIGREVHLMAGAKLVGSVVIGDHAVVGANAVVTRDVPAGAIVAGAPARTIGWREGFGPDAGDEGRVSSI